MTGRRTGALAAALFAAFLIDALLIRTGLTHGLDEALLGWDRIVGPSHDFRFMPWTLSALMAVTTFGGAVVRTPVTILALVWLILARRGREGVTLATAVASGAAALWVIKQLFGRARPDALWQLTAETRMSFPSGHAMGSMILYPLLGLAIARTIGGRAGWTATGIALALVIGATRVLLGVHWASDVIGGWLIGGAWALAALAIADRFSAGAPRAR